MNIVIMGGSFNPPTMAHLEIMEAAMNAVQADRGLWIPVSFPYLKRKMIKAGESHRCLSNERRIRLLEAMAAEDCRIQIDTDAMQDPYADDVGIMRLLKKRDPDASLYYVAGADKLELLDHFARKKPDFFELCRCILFARDGGQLMEAVAADPNLAPHLDNFIPIPPPEGAEGVSSTRIREHLFDIDAVSEMLHPAVVEILKGIREADYPEEILQFKGAYAFLSNDFAAPIEYEGIQYQNVAGAYLASWVKDPAERRIIAGMRTEKAKQRYGAGPMIPGQEDIAAARMEELVRLKFTQHPDLMDQLRATGSRKLINGSKNPFWGFNTALWTGCNRLGEILMRIRAE